MRSGCQVRLISLRGAQFDMQSLRQEHRRMHVIHAPAVLVVTW